MKFSDLTNPAAAAALIEEFRRRFSAKECFAPVGSCAGGIVAAHTLSVESMLRPISRDGHVYSIKSNLFDPAPTGPCSIGLLGINNTSTFNGFCAAHDKALFAPIEDQPFNCSNEQLFMHAYRAIAKENYLKRKQAEAFPLPDDIKEIHGLPKELEVRLSDDAILAQAASLRGAEEIERTKQQMDKHLVAGDWRRIVTTVIPFSKRPTVVCNSIHAPDFDFEGNYLQEFEDWAADLSQLMVTITPTPAAGFAGFALLSYLDTANPAPRRMVASLIARADITSSILWLVFYHAENFAISPVWYESLLIEQSAAISQAYHSNVDMFDAKLNQLRDCKIAFDSWEPGKPFTL